MLIVSFHQVRSVGVVQHIQPPVKIYTGVTGYKENPLLHSVYESSRFILRVQTVTFRRRYRATKCKTNPVKLCFVSTSIGLYNSTDQQSCAVHSRCRFFYAIVRVLHAFHFTCFLFVCHRVWTVDGSEHQVLFC